MKHELYAVFEGSVAGRFIQQGDRRTLEYDPAWRAWEGALAFSLSLPLTSASHPPGSVDAWLWGLLPDNETVLERWGRTFGVSSRNPFRLLQHVGAECAGAFQLVPDPAKLKDPGEITWLDERDIETRLAEVRADPSRTRAASDLGQFSLAGAQPKIALLRLEDRWGVPSGATPTTHILKPPIGDYESFVENEHFCLRLAPSSTRREGACASRRSMTSRARSPIPSGFRHGRSSSR